MTAQPLPALASGDPSAWDQALYAFLIERGNRSGSRRTVESYGRMLWPFFADLGKTPERVTRSTRSPGSTASASRAGRLREFFDPADAPDGTVSVRTSKRAIFEGSE